MNDSIYWLWLTMLPGIGPVNGHQLIEKYDSAKCIYENRNDIKDIISGIDKESYFQHADAVVQECVKKGIFVIAYDNIYYKEDLKKIFDFPLVLFAKGDISIATEQGIAIVGARRCSENGKKRAIDLTQRAVLDKQVVISGLAKGIDSYAHTAALRSGGKTIAVLGNGVDICYPREHNRLYQMISERGLIISEYPPGIPPKQYNFPRRNRIIAALSDSLYVIDARKRSGTQSTVVAANKYGRRVFMVDCYE